MSALIPKPLTIVELSTSMSYSAGLRRSWCPDGQLRDCCPVLNSFPGHSSSSLRYGLGGNRRCGRYSGLPSRVQRMRAPLADQHLLADGAGTRMSCNCRLPAVSVHAQVVTITAMAVCPMMPIPPLARTIHLDRPSYMALTRA